MEDDKEVEESPSSLFAGVFFREVGHRSMSSGLTRYQRLMPELYREVDEGGRIVEDMMLDDFLRAEFNKRIDTAFEVKKKFLRVLETNDTNPWGKKTVSEVLGVNRHLHDIYDCLVRRDFIFLCNFPDVQDALWNGLRSKIIKEPRFQWAIWLHRSLSEIIPLFERARSAKSISFKNIHGKEIESDIEDGVLYLGLLDACAVGHLEVVKYCVEKSREVNKLCEKDTALFVAVENGHDDVVKYLITQGMKIKACHIKAACQKGFLNILQMFVEVGEGVRDLLGPEGCCLDEPKKYEFTAVVKYLLEQGADVAALDYGGIARLCEMQKRAGWNTKWFLETLLSSYITKYKSRDVKEGGTHLCDWCESFLSTVRDATDENVAKLRESHIPFYGKDDLKVLIRLQHLRQFFLDNRSKFGPMEKLPAVRPVVRYV